MRLKTLGNQMRVYMNPHDYQTMLGCADSRRAHLTMRLMGEAGLRIGEVVDEVQKNRLRDSTHPSVDIWFLTLYGKDTKDRDTDGKRRDVWIPQSLKEEMDRYQQDEGRSDDLPLLLKSKRSLQNDIEATREHAVEKTGNEDFRHISCHDFRAYFATNMLLREGVDVETVMELGGWEDRQSMDPYINASFDDIIQQNLAAAGALEKDVDTETTELEALRQEMILLRDAVEDIDGSVSVDRDAEQRDISEFADG
jgi:integrase